MWRELSGGQAGRDEGQDEDPCAVGLCRHHCRLEELVLLGHSATETGNHPTQPQRRRGGRLRLA